MTFTFRPARRERTPLVIGIAGPTKSGKTYSAHRVAVGLAQGGPVAMLNAEGAKGHQYADEFDYLACDIEAPFRPERYTEALKAALLIDPAVLIVDSVSHMHNGPGGMIEYQAAEKARMGGGDNVNFTAWIKPKAAENQFIYALLGAPCHVILCFRAKEKIKIVKGAEPIELGWQPIASESIPFETIFTLMLPPNSKGVPDLAISQMRKPFDSLIPSGKPLDEETGVKLAAWAAGGDKSGAVGNGLAGADGPAAPVFDAPEEDVLAAQEAAGFVVVLAADATDRWPDGLTLAQVAGRDDGAVFFAWALDADRNTNAELREAAGAYAKVMLPGLFATAAA